MNHKRLCLLSGSVFLIFLGLFCILISPSAVKYIVNTQMVLTPGSKATAAWEHIPEMIPMDFYFFNWTNPEEVYSGDKPKFQQVGPYKFMMDLKKTDVVWNDNGTVTYKQRKFWEFSPEGTNGSLQDVITILNTPAVGAAHAARSWSYLVRKGVSITLSSIGSKLHVTHTVDELLFTGYPDTLTKMASSLPVFEDQNLPQWDRFGWFYMRNGSTDLDGVCNIGTGINSTFGKVYSWNYWSETPYFNDNCNKVRGSSGINFDASHNTVEMFLPDFCRTLTFQYVGDSEIGGITGKKYILGDYTFDNGTLYPENKCYCGGECIPSGVFNMSNCRFGSPTFLSLPHFYGADPYYTSAVEGMQPNKDQHEFYMIIEPKTGIPLEVNAKIQVNFLVHPVPDISLFEDVPTVYFPIIWFDQKATTPKEDLSLLRILLNVPMMITSTGIFIILVGVCMLMVLSVPAIYGKRRLEQREEESPLKSEYLRQIS